MRDETGDHSCGADAAAFVLGALEPAEADAFRRHLSDCGVCQDEVAALGQVADALHLVTPQLRAPRGLRRRIMRAVRAEPRHDVIHSPLRPGPGARRAVLGAALALVLAFIVFGAAELLAPGPGSRLIRASVMGVPGRVELRVADGHAELLLSGFAPPPSGHVYEVWLKRPGRAPTPTSALFSVTANGAGEVGVPGNLHGVGEVLVTPEPDGGSLVPTHSPVVVAQLS